MGTLLADILLVNTGDKYSEKYVDNIIHMLSTTGTKYDKVHVIRDEQYDDVWNKLQLFRDFKEGPYLYFDLDVCITQNVEHLVKEGFTLLHAYWRGEHHTPLNSSIMSWQGDKSHIFKVFEKNPEYYMLAYAGIDEYIYKEGFAYDTYNAICSSYNWQGFDPEWPVILFNQAHEKMLEEGPWSKFMRLE